MAAVVALFGGLGKRKFTRFPTAFVCLTNPGTRAVLWRSCSQYKQVTSSEDLVFVGRNKKKSQKQLRELKY
uniref:Mitochondrial ribosomal protein S18C n=1 Tax=Ovis aries TaxID=9940 RepID=A0AC11BQU8_SHEEP